MVWEKAHFVQDFFLGRAEECEGGGRGDRGAVVGEFHYVGGGEDAVEEG